MSTDSKPKRRAEVHRGIDYSAVLWSDHEWTENYIARLHDDQHKNHAETLAAAINTSIDLETDGFDALDAIKALPELVRVLKRTRGLLNNGQCDTLAQRMRAFDNICNAVLTKAGGQ